MIEQLQIDTHGQGLVAFTGELQRVVRESEQREGLCTLFIRHTSASLLVQENHDASVRHDLEQWLDRLVPEGDSLYTHTLEGADDMPAHIKCALTATSLAIPIIEGELALGTWQGVFLWEHRHQPQRRTVVVHISD